jgi:ADP-heptose:LPS heptosyltransferase
MKSLITKTSRLVRNLVTAADYFFWFLFDPSKFTNVDKNKIKKILVIHLGAMGEILVATPLLSALKNEINAKITFLLKEGNGFILENNPNVDNILTFKKTFRENLSMIKKEKFDLAVVLWPGYPAMTFLCLWAGIKYRIGCFKNVKDGVNFFLTRHMLDLRKKHAVESNLDIARLIGIDNNNPKLEFRISKKDESRASHMLKRFGAKNYIVVHPGFSFSTNIRYPSRLWPPERYAKVIDSLIEKYKVKVFITGSKIEKPFAEEIKKQTKQKKGVILLNGLTNINELAMIISRAKLLIAPGTGTIHLACAFDTKIIELMGKESPEEWHPWTNKKNYKIIFHPEVCTECDKNYCVKKTQECMLAITPEEVIGAAKPLLNNK